MVMMIWMTRIMPAGISRFRGRYTGTYPQIARNKVGGLDKKIFEDAIAEFEPIIKELKPLARELGNALFLIIDVAIFTGTSEITMSCTMG
jgi:hypothetical protein